MTIPWLLYVILVLVAPAIMAAVALEARSLGRFVTCDSMMLGMSAAINPRNVGAPMPDTGPANMVCAACVFMVNNKAGVLPGLTTVVVKSGDRLPELKLVTVPLPVPGKVWPAAKVRMPLFAIDNPVKAGVQLGLLLQNIKFRDGVVETCNPNVFVPNAPADCRLNKNEFWLTPVPLGGITNPPAAAELLPKMFRPVKILD